MDNQQQNQDIIIAAAANRFRHYGFSKSTMAEIAADCQMSAANIYRFFSGKKEILAEIVVRHYTVVETHLAEIVDQPQWPAREKIARAIHDIFALNYEFFRESPQIKDSIDYICQEREDLIKAHSKNKVAFISSILQQGVDSGEFAISDVEKRAKAIIHASILFHSPMFFDFYSYDELLQHLSGVTTALLEGVNK